MTIPADLRALADQLEQEDAALAASLAAKDARITELEALLAPPTTVSKLGVSFGGPQPATLANYEKWLGHPVSRVMCFTEPTSMPVASPRPTIWSPKWLWKPTATADSVIVSYCRALVSTGQADAILRPMWEANGPWMTGWYAPTDPTGWKARWRHIVSVCRGVSSKFRFDWSPSITTVAASQAEGFYPGDDVVDFCGMDVYGHYPVGQWETAATGLAWLKGFAARHGKPFAFAEWGVTNVDDPAYLAAMGKYIRDPACAYAIYNEYDAPDGSHALMSGRYPQAAALVRSL